MCISHLSCGAGRVSEDEMPATVRVANASRFTREFADDVRRDLALSPKQLQSKYLYDALGSTLFEAICRLPWYKITRAERSLLNRYADQMVAPLEGDITIAELGGGSGEKTAILSEAVRQRQCRLAVHLIDISQAALAQSERTVGQLQHVSAVGYRATYEAGLRIVAKNRPASGTLLVLFLGSNIGNFDPPAALEFLRKIRRTLRPGDALLLGTDLVKAEAGLIQAYDDPLGVTAAFNKNLLARMNAELGANFHLHAFDHRAIFNQKESRVEMHLVSKRAQVVQIPEANCSVSFEKGEYIWTESSYKFHANTVLALAAKAKFRCHEVWLDPGSQFASNLFIAE